MVYFVKEKMGVNTNILEKIKEIRDYFQSIQEYETVVDGNDEKVNVNEIVKILSNIINENNNEKEIRQTIGEKISKLNFEKYIKCNEDLDLLMTIYKHIEKEKGPILIENKIRYDDYTDVFVDINIYKLQEVHREVKQRIKVFSNNKK